MTCARRCGVCGARSMTARAGVIAQCEWGNDTPRENVEAVFEAWLEPLDA
ncbi:MAG: hypothetical protein M5R40_05170 [Anaerolineae bacterium]|nr:hypothetical protein [Anaerolineae bacterium]